MLLAIALVVALLILALIVDDGCECDPAVDVGPVPTSSTLPSTTTTVQVEASTTSTTQVDTSTTTTEPSTLERTG